MGKKTKNGLIELLRFIFCIIVLVFHVFQDVNGGNYANTIDWRGLFRYGYLAVDFFFIVSGYFMANSISRMPIEKADLLSETGFFMWKKIKVILPYHLGFNFFFLLYYSIQNSFPTANTVTRISDFFFLNTIGFRNQNWMLGSEWYIGNMLFVMLILFPVLRFQFRFVSGYIAPISGLIIYGIFASQNVGFNEVDRIVRAFGAILLGVSSFHFSNCLKKHTFSTEVRISFSIITITLIVGFILYMNSNENVSMQPIMIVLLWFAMIIIFSGVGYLSSKKIFNNSVFYFLGEVSLPIYIIQNIVRSIVVKLYQGYNPTNRILISLSVTIVAGIIAFYIYKGYKLFIERTNKRAMASMAIFLLLTGSAITCSMIVKDTVQPVDQNTLEKNKFIVYYHIDEDEEPSDQITEVEYGVNTAILSINQLNFSKPGYSFTGWKAYRTVDNSWRVISPDNKSNWNRVVPFEWNFYIYPSDALIAKTTSPGTEVHLYACWSPIE